MTTRIVSSLRIFLVFLLSSPVVISLMTSTAYPSAEDSNLLSSDVNDDGIVNILDLGAISRAWSSYPGHPVWNPRADLNDDEVVNIVDMVILMKDFGIIRVHYDFNEPLDWNVVGGTWNTVDGLLEGSSDTEGLIYLRNMTWRDCTLTAKVKIAANSPRAEAALCVGFVDSGNLYWAGLGCWGHRVSVSRMIGYVPEELMFSGASAAIVKDIWYEVSVKVSGDAIMLYVNNVLELVVSDSTFTSGAVGVRLWGSHILVDHITVSGFESVAESPPRTESEGYQGFAWSAKDFFYGSVTREHFIRVRSWGFNCILIPIWWSEYIEPYKDAVGVYNEKNLQRLRSSVDLALDEGLNVILSGRVCYDPASMPSWAGWSTHDYVNLQDEGLNRYANFWEMMVQRFPDCMYCLWHMPYHMQSVNSERMNRFYEATMPTLISAVRKHSSNKIVFVPIHQHPKYYKTATPFDDANIIYGVGHMMPWEVVDFGNWDYDARYFDDLFAGVKRWKEAYDLPMVSVEYGGLKWKRGTSIDQSRLNCLRESLRRMNLYSVGWTYWWLTIGQNTDENIIGNIENFEPNREILNMLESYLA